MLNLKQYRTRALKAISRRVNNFSGKDVIAWDYQLDDLARECLKLPSRPDGDLPYIGWLGAPVRDDSDAMKTSQKGINLIKRWEGFRSEAYLCPANVWTVGYGHTEGVFKGQCVSKEHAETMLKNDLLYFEQQVNKLVKVKLTQEQFDALVSFTYNVGVGAFSRSTLLSALNREDYQEAANQFSRWVHGGGKKLPGLVSRRKDERELFLS